MAFPNDMSRTTDMVAGQTAADPNFVANSKKAARNLIRRTYVLSKPAVDGSAAATTAYTAAWQLRMPRAFKVLGAAVQPQSTLTADNTNNAVIDVAKGDGLGGAGVAMATITTNIASGNWVAGGSKVLTLSATEANTRGPANSVLSFQIAKGGTGVAVPICNIVVDVEEEDIDGYAV